MGSPLMQQQPVGMQTPQMGGQFGGYIQQLQKQIGGLQNQIQALNQKQPQQAAGTASVKRPSYTPKSIFTREDFDNMIAGNPKLSQGMIDAPQYKSYEAYIGHMTKPRMTREEFDAMISRKPGLSSMAPQYKSYEAFLEHESNRRRRKPYTAAAAALANAPVAG